MQKYRQKTHTKQINSFFVEANSRGLCLHKYSSSQTISGKENSGGFVFKWCRKIVDENQSAIGPTFALRDVGRQAGGRKKSTS